MEITGPQMVLTMKLTTFAWNVWDGRRPVEVSSISGSLSHLEFTYACRNWINGNSKKEYQTFHLCLNFWVIREMLTSSRSLHI
jgi:hypothetical protein